MELYIYNSSLDLVGIIDEFTSLIWAKRYFEVGDCELYVPAEDEFMNYLKIGHYIRRSDDDMICQIKKIELDTDAENGNYIIASGFDSKKLLDQRVVLSTRTANGSAEVFARSLVNDALGSTAAAARQLRDGDGNLIFGLGAVSGLPEMISEQVSYKNVGEKIREYCRRFGWGYRVYLDSGILKFELYTGLNRTGYVIFSDNYENLAATKYIVDETNMGNLALVAGEGEGSARAQITAQDAESAGADRYEIYVDARDVSRVISFEELKNLYGSTAEIVETAEGYGYQVPSLDVQVIDDIHLAWLQEHYPDGTVITVSGVDYYRMTDVIVADLQTAEPEDTDDTSLLDVVYLPYLFSRGHDNLAEFGAVTSFEGTIEPNTTFKYKSDYDLGDIVTVQSEYNISVAARIAEVVEVYDENGYTVEPKFEYISKEGSVNG